MRKTFYTLLLIAIFTGFSVAEYDKSTSIFTYNYLESFAWGFGFIMVPYFVTITISLWYNSFKRNHRD